VNKEEEAIQKMSEIGAKIESKLQALDGILNKQ
jgi:hypothetical protein